MNKWIYKSKRLYIYIFNPLVFTDLLKQMWEAKNTGHAIAPTYIKQKISYLSPAFSGYQ